MPESKPLLLHPSSPPSGSGARQLALELLRRWEAGRRPGARPRFLHDLLEETAATRRLDRREQALLWELVLGVIRWQARLDYYLNLVSHRPTTKIPVNLKILLRLLAYQLLFLDRIPASAAVNEAVKLAKSLKLPAPQVAYVNAVGRRLAREGRRLPRPQSQADPVANLAVTESFPPWLAERWLTRLGAEAAWARARALNALPPLTIRVNEALVSPPELLRILEAEGVAAVPCRFSPMGLTLQKLPVAPFSLPSFGRGYWLFQDEAAQLVSYLLAARPGQHLLEIGAGRGGKTSHLAALLQGQGLLLALDLESGRLRQLGAALARLHLPLVPRVAADATRPLPLRPDCRVDGILIDAPCSGLGVLRRHPELKWRRQPEDIANFATRQQAMLRQAAPYLRPGGRLVYVTCTTEPEENEAVVASFLQEHPDFSQVAAPEAFPPWVRPFLDSAGFFRTLPEGHGLDGFFAATLERSR